MEESNSAKKEEISNTKTKPKKIPEFNIDEILQNILTSRK